MLSRSALHRFFAANEFRLSMQRFFTHVEPLYYCNAGDTQRYEDGFADVRRQMWPIASTFDRDCNTFVLPAEQPAVRARTAA